MIAIPASPVVPVTVLRADASVSGPVVADGWFAWTRGPVPYRLPMLPHTDVYVRRGRAPAWRVNPPGTYAQTGGIAAGKLVIQFLHYRSVLALVDLRTRRLRLLPETINVPHALEWRPSMTCPDNHCRAYRYDVVTGARVEMPPVGGAPYSQFGPSVTRDGTVYFGVARACADVRLMRWRHGHVRTIYRFPPGTAYDYSYATGTRPATVYYDEGGCSWQARTRIDAIRDVVP